MSPRYPTYAEHTMDVTYEQRRQELVEANARLDEAERVRQVVANMREDVARMEQQRDALAALGDGHVEVAQSSFDQRFRVMIEWEPIRSKLTGLELAAEVEASIGPLRQELASTESRIASLLA
jgi:DNA repair exonuclease SbcCD ATPase subunit